MTTLFSALDWRTMSQEARDLGLNNGVAVPGSVDMVAGWEQRSADVRKRVPGHIDMRYGARERNRIDFLKAGEQAPTPDVAPPAGLTLPRGRLADQGPSNVVPVEEPPPAVSGSYAGGGEMACRLLLTHPAFSESCVKGTGLSF